MFFDGLADRTALHARIDELERRLAVLEDQSRRADPPDPPTVVEQDRRDPSERRFGRRTTDRLNRVTDLEEADAGREGARLVALEMLNAGHRPEQVATYLRETFNLDEADAALAVAGRVAE